MRKWLLLFLLIHLSSYAAPAPVEQQASQLRTLIRQADDSYYNQSKSLMSDASYDALKEQYQGLVSQYPELADPENVGAAVQADSHKVPHSAPVLSLAKAYSDSEVDAFIGVCGRTGFYSIEPKIDGLTVILKYRDGSLIQAVTRGNGTEGTDVTAAVLASGAVPVLLTNAPPVLDLRGEAFLSRAAFVELNRRRAVDGNIPLKSARNSASGTLRLLDFAEVARRALSIHVFEVLTTDKPTHSESLACVRGLGLPVVQCRRVAGGAVLAAITELNAQRAELPYATDGVVIKLDDLAAFNALGSTAHHPRGALARKYREVPVETQLLRIEWTEKGVPVGCFEPVEVDGATIQRATLHNREHLRALNLAPGDRIQVIRSGGSIPEIIGRIP
jgi:DNA ligase (NAD+)